MDRLWHRAPLQKAVFVNRLGYLYFVNLAGIGQPVAKVKVPRIIRLKRFQANNNGLNIIWVWYGTQEVEHFFRTWQIIVKDFVLRILVNVVFDKVTASFFVWF